MILREFFGLTPLIFRMLLLTHCLGRLSLGAPAWNGRDLPEQPGALLLKFRHQFSKLAPPLDGRGASLPVFKSVAGNDGLSLCRLRPR